MASGHVNRTQRPNTWPHRPSLLREENSCQPGAVHTWPEADLPRGPLYGLIDGEADLERAAVTDYEIHDSVFPKQ